MASTVVIAPDSFKGTATADEVAVAIAGGWSSVRPGDRVILAPMADGGEGTLLALRRAVPGAVRHAVDVTGPDGRRVSAEWLMLPDRTGVIELAATSGIGLMQQLAPMTASTVGFGEAIADALSAGATRLLLALGGSASTDGGTGALTALGARFLDEQGEQVPAGGGGLTSLRSADLSGLPPLPPRGAHILSDVDSPLLGPAGAAHVFAPQKGATPEQVAELEAGLARLAATVGAPDVAGAGAAGGTAYGLLAWGATLGSGAAAVGAAVGLAALIADADVVITGEGRYDAQSSAGKVTDYVAALARDAGADVLLAAGLIHADTGGYLLASSLSDVAGGPDPAMREPRRWSEAAGVELARGYSALR